MIFKESMFYGSWIKLWVIPIILNFMLFGRAQGGFATPALEEVSDALEGITVDPLTDAITITENVGSGQGSYSLAKIKLSEPGDIRPVGDELPYFEIEKIEPDVWLLKSVTAFDYDITPPPEFRVEYQADSAGSGALRLRIFIRIVDVNDNPPKFVGTDPTQVPAVPELMIPSTRIVRIIAEDGDKDDTITYGLDEGGEFFRIDDRGDIYLAKELDYSDRISHRLTVTMQDNREPYFTETTSLVILVEDVPNTPPQFTRPPILRSVLEESEIGDVVLTVSARDGDYGLNWDITYELEDELGLFGIDPDTGIITVESRIDAEMAGMAEREFLYSFKITAKEIYDEAEYPDLTPEETQYTETVNFTIQDIDDQPPTLCSVVEEEPCVSEDTYQFEIPEDHTGQITFNKPLRIKDLDSTPSYSRFTASFAPDTPELIAKAFSISPTQGTGDEEFFLVVKDRDLIDYDKDQNWHDENGDPKPIEFKVEIKGALNQEFVATATISAKVTDVNDNLPKFKLPNGQTQYEFIICENINNLNTPLKNMIPGTEQPTACKNAVEGDEIVVVAEDLDVTPGFGQPSVIYRWSSTTRQPPVTLNPTTGQMTVTLADNFDYERFQEEIYIVEAVDSDGTGDDYQIDSVPVRFAVLDKNDVTVDLKLSTLRTSIDENTETGSPVLGGIVATDVDVTANIELTVVVNTFFTKAKNGSMTPHQNPAGTMGLVEDMEKWFKLEIDESQSSDSHKVASLVVGELLPDREGYGEREVDRVDLTIQARDLNAETGEQVIRQVVTINILDINDNSPKWPPGDDYSNRQVTILEVENWGDEGDTSTPYEREIFTIRATDPDTGTEFEFTLSNPKCREDPDFANDVCDEMLNLVELIPNDNPNIGNALLSRRAGQVIDREERKYFKGDTDVLYYTITVSDGEGALESEVAITVDDRNDNTPVFKGDYSQVYLVDELEETEKIIVTIVAEDADRQDKFGKVSYLIVDGGGNDKGLFIIDLESGALTAVPGSYDWNTISNFRVQVKAIDYYREGTESGSNADFIDIQIRVTDMNNHAPEFVTPQGSENPLVTIPERDPTPGIPFPQKITIRDLDNPALPNGMFELKDYTVVKDPSFPSDPNVKTLFNFGSLEDTSISNTKELPMIPTRNFTGLWGTYTITLTVCDRDNSDPAPLCEDGTYVVEVENENLNKPIFEWPEDETTSIAISIEYSVPFERLRDMSNNDELIPDVKATDHDSGNNGVVGYTLDPSDVPEECTDIFDIGPVNGRIFITKPLNEEDHANLRCQLLINAQDRGEKPQLTVRPIVFRLLIGRNTPPAFPSPEIEVRIIENDTSLAGVEFTHAIDPDIEQENPVFPDDKVFYYLAGGDSDGFDLTTRDDEDEHGHDIRIPILSPKAVLDRETIPTYKITIFTSNFNNEQPENVDPENVDPDNTQYTVLTVILDDVKDTPPTFEIPGVITAGFSTMKKTDDIISIITALDKDLEDPVGIEVTSDFTASDQSLPQIPGSPPFELVPSLTLENTKEVKLKFDPQPSYRGYYRFQITATDSVGMTVQTTCQMYMITNNNILRFYFENDREYVEENKQALANILTEVTLFHCNIDRIITDNALGGAQTTVETHFIELETNVLQSAEVIQQLLLNNKVYSNLIASLNAKNLTLANQGVGGNKDITKEDSQIVTYVLIGGVAILFVALLVLSATCFFNNRSLSRRVRALTATTFGSQKSDLNRIGVTMDAPNTNAFAIQGSNPIWTTDTEPKTYQNFDAESVGSGGSVLIGAEDEEYFQGTPKNPMFLANDVVANYDDSENDASDRRSYGNYDVESYPNDRQSPVMHNDDEPDSSPFGARLTKNPLMNMGMSVDVDDPSDTFFDENNDASFFDGNNDASLF